jgi:hypothetical protein
MLKGYSVPFSGSIPLRSLQAPASGWRPYNESFIGTEGAFGLKLPLEREPPFILACLRNNPEPLLACVFHQHATIGSKILVRLRRIPREVEIACQLSDIAVRIGNLKVQRRF